MQQLGDVIDLLSLLNSSVNFILYSTMSNLFRREFISAFRECCPWERILQRKKSIQRTPLTRNGSAPPRGAAHTASLKNQILRSPVVSTKIGGDQEHHERLIDVTSSGGMESAAANV